MKKLQDNTFKGLAYSVSALALIASAPAFAQDADEGPDGVTSNSAQEEDPVDVTDTGATGQQTDGAIVVTGSRIKRDTYTSISPLQVLTTDQSQNTGLFDPTQILQRSESASGTQIDATFSGFVLDNGPGSETVNLRGLGADRTLLLINGRRMAPAGVEGAPTNPSINLLPASLIDRYDLLLDGASSVYGSDAVAGVGNVILRKDFDGLELFAGGDVNEDGGGNDYTVSAAWGFNDDRSFFGIGAEYRKRDIVRFGDRPFLADCDTHYEITQDGEIRTVGVRDNAIVMDRTPGVSVSESPCKIGGISGRIFNPYIRYGSIYYTDGPSNSGIPGFNESTAGGVDIDANGDGIRDVDFQNVNTNGQFPNTVLIPEQDVYNVMAYGETTFAGPLNITPFFEANYSRADIRSFNDGAGQVFPSVPADNAFNPCNIATGVDCALAEVTLFGNALFSGFNLPVIPIASIVGDRDNYDVKQEQYRVVGGVKFDMPFLGSSWTGEIASVWSRSEGKSSRRGIREDKLAFALGIDPTADFDGDGIVDNNGDGIADDYDPNVDFFVSPLTPCDATGLANPELAMPDLTDGCVAVDLFNGSVLGQTIGDFATQAERDYLFGTRSFDTTYEQIMFNAFASGDLFSLPAGDVSAVFGLEWREDRINSDPSPEASNGLFFAFFNDSGARGSKWIREAFAEVDIPLQANKPWVRELNLNLSGRLTDEEFYGTAGTYSIKGGWRPIDPLLLKMSYGTSFRAPNLRENFLLGQSGFLTLIDPCAVPNDALVGGAYDPALDDRDVTTLQNCRREGRDPEDVGFSRDANGNILNTLTQPSVEIDSGGSLDLDPEESRSITAGVAFEETFGDGYDVSLNFNYYDIKIKGAIVEPSSQFIINDCFLRDDGQRSQFCDRISYDVSTDNAARNLINAVSAGFINLNEESVRGIDLNGFFGKEVSMFGKLVDLGLNVRANHLIERSEIFIDDFGEETIDDDAGEFRFPSWTGRATLTAEVDEFLFTWETRWIGEVAQEEEDVDEFDDAFGNLGTPFRSDTCTGLGPNGDGVGGDGLFCRDVGFADDYFVHTASIRYRNDSWTLRAGVRNLFDKAPPKVDSNEVTLVISNTPLGSGYDLDGREFFFSVRKAF